MALIEGGKSMGVTEIQGELRKIQTQLSALELQLEDMKPKANEENQEKYKKINTIAEKYQIKIRHFYLRKKMYGQIMFCVWAF